MAGELAGKVAIVTGGARGLGQGMVELFVEEGARVVIADLRDEEGQALADKLGQAVRYRRTDVSSREDVQGLVDYAVAEFGGLNAICNNAGLSDNLFGPLLDADFSMFEKIMAVNVMGVMLGTQIAARHMAKHGGGAVINTSSISGIQPGFGFFTYRASKAAVVNFTKSAAIELGPAPDPGQLHLPGQHPHRNGRLCPRRRPGKGPPHPRGRRRSADGLPAAQAPGSAPRHRRGRAVVRQRPLGPGDRPDHGGRCRRDGGQPVQPDRRHHGGAGAGRGGIGSGVSLGSSGCGMDSPVPPRFGRPEARERIALIASSYRRLLGKPLVPPSVDPVAALWHAPLAIVAHGTEPDPLFFFASRAALAAFAAPLDQFIGMPSRLSAEALDRAERQALLDRVSARGFIDDYAGMRVKLSGERFRIEEATVWNLIDAAGLRHGQAAAFAVPP